MIATMTNNRKISFSLSLSLSAYRLLEREEEIGGNIRENVDPCLKRSAEKARELVYKRVSRARFPSLLSRTRPLSRLSSAIPTRGIHVAAT